MTPYKGPLGSLERPEQGAASLRAMLVRKLASSDVDDDMADIHQYYGDMGHDSINAAVSHQRAERIVRRGECHGGPDPGRSIGTCGIPSSRNSSPSRTNPCAAYISCR